MSRLIWVQSVFPLVFEFSMYFKFFLYFADIILSSTFLALYGLRSNLVKYIMIFYNDYRSIRIKLKL